MGWKQGSSGNTEVCMSVVMICLWNEDWEIFVANGMGIENQNVMIKLCFPPFHSCHCLLDQLRGQA